MTKPNPKNEIIKREYFHYLREAGGRDPATIDCVAKSLTRFEESTNRRDFKRFHREQAVAFKARLRDAVNARTGERLSKATVLSALRDLRAFFIWLGREPGYKSHIAYSDADYFNLADKDVAVARARREPKPPTPEQVRRVLNAMAAATVLERRDRAVVAFAAVTGARVRALTTFPLGAVDPSLGTVEHDARLVRTKGGKTFRSDFHRVVPGAAEIVVDWCAELAECHGWGRSDPLFPQNDMGLDENGGFVAIGLARKGWATSEPVRAIFKRAFAAAGIDYHNPHSLRALLVRHYMAMNLTHAQMKAVSQSLGHADIMTTFSSYGQIPSQRQSELIREIAAGPVDIKSDPVADLLAAADRVKAVRALTLGGGGNQR
jgi:site-specific recombinase XerD